MNKVCQYTQDMVLVATYPSTRKAASAVGMSPTAISMNCLGRTRNCGGFIFIYAPSESEDKKLVADGNKDHALDLYSRAFAFALSLTGNKDDSNDLVQDAFLKYYDTDVTGEAAYKFLMQTIKYEWMKEKSRRSFTASIEGFEFCLSSSDSERMEERIERERRTGRLQAGMEKLVTAALSSIKTEKRRKKINRIFHWYLQGMSAAEVGKKMNIQVQSAKQEILSMRRFVSEALDIPLREFTQYNCRIV